MSTPKPGLASIVQTGGQPVTVANAGTGGGYVTNPLSAADQGVAAAEVLYVDPVGPCVSLAAGGTIIALQPGDTFALVPGSTLPTTANAASGGHKFTVVLW